MQVLYMLMGFARTGELFEAEKTLRVYADHWNWLRFWSGILNFDALSVIVNSFLWIWCFLYLT
jgi:hypothetical protein